MELDDEQLERYARHIVLKEVGGAGQKKLLESKVLVVGAGGLGSPVLLYLAAAGVGTLGIVDDDTVSLSNLQRQIAHDSDRIGQTKTASAAARIAAINPNVNVIVHNERLTAENAASLLGGYDLVADGCDNFATRFTVADACQAMRIPLVSGAVHQFDGQVAVFKGYEPGLPCYRCLVPDTASVEDRSCADEGILGAVAGVVGSLQATEAIKELTGAGEPLAGRILIYDALSARVRTVTVPKDPACPLCGPSAPPCHPTA